MALLTSTEVKDWVKVAGTGDDAIVDQILASALDRVQEYLNFVLEEATYTDEKYDGTGTRKLVLRQYPITAFTKLEVYDGLDSDGVETWDEYIQNEDYDRLEVVNSSYLLMDGARFTLGYNNVRVTYTAGYLTATLPAKIMKAILDLCYIYYHAIRADKSLGKTSNVQQSGVGSSTTTYEANAEKRILESIASFKIWNV